MKINMRNQHDQLETSSVNKNDPFVDDSHAKQVKISVEKNQCNEILFLS